MAAALSLKRLRDLCRLSASGVDGADIELRDALNSRPDAAADVLGVDCDDVEQLARGDDVVRVVAARIEESARRERRNAERDAASSARRLAIAIGEGCAVDAAGGVHVDPAALVQLLRIGKGFELVGVRVGSDTRAVELGRLRALLAECRGATIHELCWAMQLSLRYSTARSRGHVRLSYRRAEQPDRVLVIPVDDFHHAACPTPAVRDETPPTFPSPADDWPLPIPRPHPRPFLRALLDAFADHGALR